MESFHLEQKVLGPGSQTPNITSSPLFVLNALLNHSSYDHFFGDFLRVVIIWLSETSVDYVHLSIGAHRGHRKTPGPQELEL